MLVNALYQWFSRVSKIHGCFLSEDHIIKFSFIFTLQDLSVGSFLIQNNQIVICFTRDINCYYIKYLICNENLPMWLLSLHCGCYVLQIGYDTC